MASLTTERLVLRPFRADDLDRLVELDSDPEVMRFLTGGTPTSREVYIENLPRMMAPSGRMDCWVWAAETRRDNAFVGWFSLRPDPRRSEGEVELGYRLRRAAWNQGYASEGVSVLLARAFDDLGLDRVFALTMTVNLASRRIMEKTGLRLVKVFMEDWPDPIPGAEHGDVEYAMSRLDWARRGEAGRLKALAARVPDIPRWVELRDGLLRGEGEVHGTSDDPDFSFACLSGDGAMAFVVGQPDAAALAACTGPEVKLLLTWPRDDGIMPGLPPGWTHEGAMLHLLEEPERLPDPGRETRFLLEEDLATADLPEALAEELAEGPRGRLISAAFVGGRPVAFCYAGAVTQTLWDISIDTLEPYRRQGHAARAVAHMVEHMRAQGLAPVWGAADGNPASWRLAARLGFKPVDRLSMFSPPET